MKAKFLLTTVSPIALKCTALAALTAAAMATMMPSEAKAEDCGWNPVCGVSNFVGGAVNVVGGALNAAKDAVVGTVVTVEKDVGIIKDPPPKAVLTTTPVTPAAPAAPAVATAAQLKAGQDKINDLVLTGVIDQATAAKALKVISNDGGSIVPHDGGTIIPKSSVVSNDGGSLVAAAALNAAGISGSLKSAVGAALVSDNGLGLVKNAAQVQQTLVAGLYDAGKITDTQRDKLSDLVKSGANVVACGAGNVISDHGVGVVGPAGGSVVSDHGLGLTAAATNALVSTNGGNLVSTNGGNLISNNPSGLISNNQSGLISNNANKIISDNSEGLLANVSSLISNHASDLISNLNSKSLLDTGSSDKAQKVANFITSVDPAPKPAAPTPAQIAMNNLSNAAGSVTTASTAVVTASDQVNKYTAALASATKANDNQLIALVNSELATAKKQLDDSNNALKAAGVVLAANSTLVDPKDLDNATKLIGNTIATVQKDSDKAKASTASTQAAVAASAAPAGPSAAQVAAANSLAQADSANKAANAEAKETQDLVQKLGTNTPTNISDITALSKKDDAAAIKVFTSNVASAQADLDKAKASGNKNDIANQQAALDKANAQLKLVNNQVANEVNLKVSLANNAVTDLTNAKAVVDGLTKAYNGTRPSDPAQLANINAAMVVQALAQDKADKLNADAQVAKLTAAGASNFDIQSQKELSAAKQKDMAGILAVNPQILATAGVAGNTDPAIVAKAISGVVSTAAKQATDAVQQTTAAVQSANAALANAKSVIGVGGPSLTPQQIAAAKAGTPTTSILSNSTDATAAVIASLKKSGETLSSMAVGKPAAVASNAPVLPGSVATSTATNPAATSTNPSGGGAPVLAAAPAGATPATAAPAAPIVPAAEIVNAVPMQNDLAAARTQANARSQQIASMNQDLASLQSQRAATTDPAKQAGIDAAINSVKFQLPILQQVLDKENKQVSDLQAKAVTAPVTATAPVASMTPAAIPPAGNVTPTVATPAGSAMVANAPTALPAAATTLAATSAAGSQPAAVANASPTATAPGTATPGAMTRPREEVIANAPVTATPGAMTRPREAVTATEPVAATPGSTTKPGDAVAAVKISDDQRKAVHAALSTIPGNLSKTEQKTFDTLSTLVDRATTKGLTQEEAVTLKAGLAALADKHPRAEQKHGLTTIANTVAVGPKPATGAATPASPAGATTTATSTPGGTAAAPGSAAKPAADTEHAMKERIEQSRTKTGMTVPDASKTTPEQKELHPQQNPAVATHADPPKGPDAGKQVVHTDERKTQEVHPQPNPAQLTHTDQPKGPEPGKQVMREPEHKTQEMHPQPNPTQAPKTPALAASTTKQPPAPAPKAPVAPPPPPPPQPHH